MGAKSKGFKPVVDVVRNGDYIIIYSYMDEWTRFSIGGPAHGKMYAEITIEEKEVSRKGTDWITVCEEGKVYIKEDDYDDDRHYYALWNPTLDEAIALAAGLNAYIEEATDALPSSE